MVLPVAAPSVNRAFPGKIAATKADPPPSLGTGERAVAPAPSGRGSSPLVEPTLLLAAQEVGQRRGSDPRELTDTEKLEVRIMAHRDAYVRQHERAHTAAGGPYVGMPRYSYQQGPDGRFYAVHGRVSIDVKPLSTAEATIKKMEMVIRAALAPAAPSFHDRAAASVAKQIKRRAEVQLRAEEQAAQEEAREQGPLGEARDAAGGRSEDTGPATAVDAYRQTAEVVAATARGEPREGVVV